MAPSALPRLITQASRARHAGCLVPWSRDPAQRSEATSAGKDGNDHVLSMNY